MSTENGSPEGLTLTVLGCGTMGIAILSGIMRHLEEQTGGVQSAPPSGISPAAGKQASQVPSKFIACVRSDRSAKRIQDSLGHHKLPLTICVGDNLKAVERADVVLLACKPQMYRDVLNEVTVALRGKLLISILAGVSTLQLRNHILSVSDTTQPGSVPRVVRAMPNTASFVQESMTVIEVSDPPMPASDLSLVTWIFSRIGRVVTLPASAMDASTALCGSGPAFMALVLEAMADGGVAMGLPRAEAQVMAAQVMRGTASLVANGEHPAILRDKVSTPGGCTIGGLLVLEEGRVRGSVARAVREATVVASQLGQGVVGVNGTRFPGSSGFSG